MADFGFVGPSYTPNSIYQDSQECINLRPEVDPMAQQGGRQVIALYGTPGLRLLAQLPNQGEVRGLRAISGGTLLMAVSGTNVWVIDKTYADYYLVGQLDTSSGPVQIVDNGIYCYIMDGANRYSWFINNDLRFTCTGTFAGTTLTVTATTGVLAVGKNLIGTNIPVGTIIVGLGSGTGGAGTYTLNQTINIVVPTTIYVNNPQCTLPLAQLSGNRLFAGATQTGTVVLGQTLVSSVAPVLTVNTIITATNAQDTGLTGTGANANGTYEINNPVLAGTVFGATANNAGTGYAAVPNLTLSAPLNTMGEQAIVTAQYLKVVTSVITPAALGSGYQIGNVLTAIGGLFLTPFTIMVTSVTTMGATLGQITGFTVTNAGKYSSPPNPLTPVTFAQATRTPTGSGATMTLTYGLDNTFNLVIPGSGYLGLATGTVSAPPTATPANITATVTIAQGVVPTFSTYYGLYFTQLPANDGAFQGGISVDIIDNLFIYAADNSQRFAASGISSPITGGLSFALKNGSPDNISSIITNNREVFILGERSTEVWVNTGGLNTLGDLNVSVFPLTRIPGAQSQHGCAATNSVARLGASIAYLSRNNRGEGRVMRLNGYIPEVISTHAVENSIQGKFLENARAFTYQLAGHEVYVLTFPDLELTWAFDSKTELWHKWQSWDEDAGVFKRLRVSTATNFDGQVVAGDYYNGKIYILDNNVYTEDGATIHRVRRAPHIVADYKQEYFSSVQIYFESGGGNSFLGRDPKASMRWSSDAGQTWTNEYWRDVGAIGKYKQRAIWRRLGRARDRVYEMRLTDPVKWVIVSAELMGDQGDH